MGCRTTGPQPNARSARAVGRPVPKPWMNVRASYCRRKGTGASRILAFSMRLLVRGTSPIATRQLCIGARPPAAAIPVLLHLTALLYSAPARLATRTLLPFDGGVTPRGQLSSPFR